MTLTWCATTSWSSRAMRTRSSSTARVLLPLAAQLGCLLREGLLALTQAPDGETEHDGQGDRDHVVGDQEALVERQVGEHAALVEADLADDLEQHRELHERHHRYR